MQALDDMTQSEPQSTLTDEERHAIAVVRNCAMTRAERFLTQSDAEREATLVLWRLRERLG
jgi:DNA replication initiation complex subunit (GINS family)